MIHMHKYVPLYRQPMHKDNVLVLECVKCGKSKIIVDAQRWLEKQAKRGKAYVFARDV